MFGFDFAVNNTIKDVDWNSYRLSLPQMRSIADNSTHLRATCNFPTEGLWHTDYARTKLKGHDLFSTWFLTCRIYEYLNIRGNECSNCTAATKQAQGKSWNINSFRSTAEGCHFDGTPGVQPGGEQNFGLYVGIRNTGLELNMTFKGLTPIELYINDTENNSDY